LKGNWIQTEHEKDLHFNATPFQPDSLFFISSPFVFRSGFLVFIGSLSLSLFESLSNFDIAFFGILYLALFDLFCSVLFGVKWGDDEDCIYGEAVTE